MMDDRAGDSSASASVPPTNPPLSPPPAPPVTQESWRDYINQQKPRAHDLETRTQILELYKQAVTAKPGSLKIWLDYCEYFWALYYDCYHPRYDAAWPWPPDELAMARELFSLDSALRLWQEGHEATKYRLSDSHELWNAWIAKELELLSRTRTADGVKRITHLFCDRLLVPQAAWAETSQAFSHFLSEHNQGAWEELMKDITTRSQGAREVYEKREPHERKLHQAVVAGDLVAQKVVMKDYLQFEIAHAIREKKKRTVAVQLSLALFSRALTGLLESDEATWTDYVVFVSTLYHRFSSAPTRDPDMLQIIPSNLSALQGAVQHCPWSGTLWARYILSGEEAGLSFSSMEKIKHAATNNSQLDRDDMVGVIDMYAAWCGYLKRSAIDPAATEETTDIADSGLRVALEAVEVWGKRRFGNAYVGDPNFRLERILIGFLTERLGAIQEARGRWLELAEKPLYAASYNFWVHFYAWELSVFQAEKIKDQCPTPGSTAKQPGPRQLGRRVPSLATDALQRALRRKDLDWPERIMEVYLQHCNDFESPETVRLAYDNIHRTKKQVAQRRQEEAAAAAAYAAASQQQRQADDGRHGSPSASKRKRATSPDGSEGASKRPKNDGDAESVQGGGNGGDDDSQKRDREHTSVIITNLPADTTQTRVKQYLREYGHVNSIIFKKVDQGQSAVAIVEFRTPQDAQSALLRDGKYYEKGVIGVKPATGLTLFVTNFPPTADDEYIRRVFRDCGEVFDIRWPSLKFNTHRRFCYVAFREQEAAWKATQLDGTLLEGQYKLEAKTSDPSQKKLREGATSEGREVKVKNLPRDANEGSVREVFEKYGKVVSVRLLRNMGGQFQGIGYVVYESKEGAEKSVSGLNSATFRNRVIAVDNTKVSNFKPVARSAPAPAASSTSPSPAPAPDGSVASPRDGEGDAPMADGQRQPSGGDGGRSKEPPNLRTFALIGISDTVNDARVRALVEKHCGGGVGGDDATVVRKVVLRPDHGGAIVEMANQAAAGKARLALEGVELDGRVIRTGAVVELLAEKPEKKKGDDVRGVDKAKGAGEGKKPTAKNTSALMLAPSRLTRPVLGQKPPKRGLGFPKPISAAPAGATSATPTDQGAFAAANGAAAAPAPKSNAQFRDLFLRTSEGGGGEKKEATGKHDK